MHIPLNNSSPSCRRIEALHCKRVTPTRYERPTQMLPSLSDHDDRADLSSMIRQMVREEVQRALASPREEPEISAIEHLRDRQEPRTFYNSRSSQEPNDDLPEKIYAATEAPPLTLAEKDNISSPREDPASRLAVPEEDIPTERTQQPQTREEILGPITRSRALRLRMTNTSWILSRLRSWTLFKNMAPQGSDRLSPQESMDDIVITGISGRFPLSDNILEFQKNLFEKVDMLSSSEPRYKEGLYGLPKRIGKIKDLSKFDPTYFNISPMQADVMDPMSRLLLESSCEALIDADHLHPPPPFPTDNPLLKHLSSLRREVVFKKKDSTDMPALIIINYMNRSFRIYVGNCNSTCHRRHVRRNSNYSPDTPEEEKVMNIPPETKSTSRKRILAELTDVPTPPYALNDLGKRPKSNPPTENVKILKALCCKSGRTRKTKIIEQMDKHPNLKQDLTTFREEIRQRKNAWHKVKPDEKKVYQKYYSRIRDLLKTMEEENLT
ncbi:FASN [Cordylochernes scorpioides]|uniref:FASN n=1 Tax=Cordylochernes scorpioides TaxID=51811 RepID=A0ABY6KT54_9ARAC|nr:FASN [Cordylochernes scorpioides]